MLSFRPGDDHKAVMKQVEAPHQLHARDKEKQARDLAEATGGLSRDQSQGLSPAQAFAKVNSVSYPGSPPASQ